MGAALSPPSLYTPFPKAELFVVSSPGHTSCGLHERVGGTCERYRLQDSVRSCTFLPSSVVLDQFLIVDCNPTSEIVLVSR